MNTGTAGVFVFVALGGTMNASAEAFALELLILLLPPLSPLVLWQSCPAQPSLYPLVSHLNLGLFSWYYCITIVIT
ncbi:MAG: hypothetical protein WCF06_16800 [Nitrososphaeraceae archaeon]